MVMIQSDRGDASASLTEEEWGWVSRQAGRTDDKTEVEAGRDGITDYEDTEVIVFNFRATGPVCASQCR